VQQNLMYVICTPIISSENVSLILAFLSRSSLYVLLYNQISCWKHWLFWIIFKSAEYVSRKMKLLQNSCSSSLWNYHVLHITHWDSPPSAVTFCRQNGRHLPGLHRTQIILCSVTSNGCSVLRIGKDNISKNNIWNLQLVFNKEGITHVQSSAMKSLLGIEISHMIS
jgi:hypothetical protein